jgi:predicted DNA-binding transcriptional regulator YafY
MAAGGSRTDPVRVHGYLLPDWNTLPMARAERLFRIVVLLREHRQLRFADLLERLEVSAPTLKRDLRYLRERLGTPIRYDAFDRCYRLDAEPRAGARREVPGLWLDERELYALAFAWHLIEQVEPGTTVSPVVGTLMQRMRSLIARDPERSRLLERIRVVVPGRRPVDPEVFVPIVDALGRRRRLDIDYFTRSRVSP